MRDEIARLKEANEVRAPAQSSASQPEKVSPELRNEAINKNRQELEEEAKRMTDDGGIQLKIKRVMKIVDKEKPKTLE